MDIANKLEVYICMITCGFAHVPFCGKSIQDIDASMFLGPCIIKLVYCFSGSPEN